MDFQDKLSYAWQILAMATLTVVGLTFLVFVVSTKKVDGYYLAHGQNGGGSGICVNAHWTWNPDQTAFCTDDYQKALDFAAKANSQVK